RGCSRLPLPPGPKKLPIVGNLFDLPSAFEWKTYMEWSRKYDSDVIHLNLAGQSLVILSSSKATDDLLEKRSSLYSDRSPFPMLVDLMGWDFSLRTCDSHQLRRTHRRLFNQVFRPTTAKKFQPTELRATHGLLRRLLHNPENFRQHIKQMTGETIMAITYGIDVVPKDDPYMSLAEETLKVGVMAVTRGFLVDSFPVLKYLPDWFPGAGFKIQAKEWRELGRRAQEIPLAETKRQIASGSAPYSFSTYSFHNLAESTNPYYTEDHVQATAAVTYLAGWDTTAAALTTFILAMLANPEAQRKAQVELDSVTGRERLPDFGDESALPYVSALIKETLRWRPVAPIGRVPHFLQVEDEYRGFKIPANSIVMGNVWAILQDETTYPEPDAFKPERFLRDGKLNPNVRDPEAAFGFGRRICPGRHMARSSIWISVACTLATFDITKALTDDGQVIEPTYEYLSGIISVPAPFECTIRPRSRDLAALVEATD
ncbi:cytochrome P450, partial [Mycena metata]